jgi:Zn-dependent peptidase ImmA (M78 family)
MANEGIPINREIITWARERAGLTPDDASKKFKRITDWESGQALPTYPQLESLADELKLPIAVFFFPTPPTMPPIRESFRTLPDIEFERMPRPVRFMLRKAKALQLNLAELTGSRNPSRRIIMLDISFTEDAQPDEMAARVRDYLGITLDAQFAWPNPDTALKAWRKAIQDVGVFVFKDAFHAQSYCGFSLYDDTLPLIYVNNSTTKTRQIFTLFHELAHILFHTSGIDPLREMDLGSLGVRQRQIEVLCNRFAGQFLVPDAAFNAALRGRDHSEQTAEYLAQHFMVSREVIYRKFRDRRWITQAEYARAVDEWNSQRKEGGGGGGDYYNTKLTYLGREYVGLALSEYRQNRIDDVQLAEYLDTKPRNLAALEEKFLASAQ